MASENIIAELVFKQLKANPENDKCFDCGNYDLIYLKANQCLNGPPSTTPYLFA